MTGRIKVVAFAGAREVIGAAELELELGDARTASEVMDAICARFPALSERRRIIRIAVNGSYVEGDARVEPGDEVALIPPVAGG